jgi:imidazole glycerol-phosphate synthase subunit HisH
VTGNVGTVDALIGQRPPRIAVIDYGIGNLRSAEKALQRVGADAFLTDVPHEIAGADAVVLPGVGAMGRCMEALQQSGLEGPTRAAIASGRPFLGVCVGMQMLHAGSTEFGGVAGLGVFPATIREITPLAADGTRFKVPHMQWNLVMRTKPSRLLDALGDPLWMYFVHSFAPEPHPGVVATADYGGAVSAVVETGTVMGTQFHPEKSGADGLRLLAGFAQLARAGSGQPS